MSLEIDNLTFAYGDAPEKPILNIKQWSVATNESVFIHGPSGVGKSTLLSLLGGLQRAHSGSISIDGQALETLNNRQRDQFRARHIGFVFQQFNLIPYLTPVENLKLAHGFGHPKSSPLTLDDIHQRLNHLVLNPNTWHKPSEHLSVGEQQRVAIARALINNPRLLIADEPTSALDEANTHAFMSLLTDIRDQQDLTLVFVSHDRSLATYFDRSDDFKQLNQVAYG